MTDWYIPPRPILECGWCGDTAAVADADGMFMEDAQDACLSCGFPGHVSVDGDEDDAVAYWVTLDDDQEVVDRWKAEHPDRTDLLD